MHGASDQLAASYQPLLKPARSPQPPAVLASRSLRLGTWSLPLHTNATGNGLWEDNGGALGARAVSAPWLPGRKAGDTGRAAVRHDLGMSTRDFAMDPSQDVIVLFKGGDEVGLYVPLLSCRSLDPFLGDR